jgi:hypothetical protein
MPVAIKGTGGGSVTLDAGAAAADTTLTLPNTTGTILQSGTAVTVAQGGTGLTSPGTAGNVLFTADGSTWSATQKIVAGTAQVSTSGTSITFTGIPSWAKRVTMLLNNISGSGTSPFLIRLGTSSGIVSTGYLSTASASATNAYYAADTTGFILIAPVATVAAYVNQGVVSIFNLSGNTWISSGNFGSVPVQVTFASSGSVSLASTLTQISITTVNGTDTFDAGSINILYE